MATNPVHLLRDWENEDAFAAGRSAENARHAVTRAIFHRGDLRESKIDAYRDQRVVDLSFEPVPEFHLLTKPEQQVFAATKEWEGIVTSVTKELFYAELKEVGASQGDDVSDMTEIPLSDVPECDRYLLREGAVFRFLVGYAKSYKGTVSRKRIVYFRRGRNSFLKDNSSKEAEWLSIAAKFRG